MGRGPSGSSTRSWSSGRGARKPRSRRETPSARSPRERFSQTRSPSAVRATRVARGYSGPREAWSFPSRTARSTPRPLMTSAKVPSPSARPQRISPPRRARWSLSKPRSLSSERLTSALASIAVDPLARSAASRASGLVSTSPRRSRIAMPSRCSSRGQASAGLPIEMSATMAERSRSERDTAQGWPIAAHAGNFRRF